MADGNSEDAVKSLLEDPIKKPVYISDAALTNLNNISHNVQESYRKTSSFFVNLSSLKFITGFPTFLWV